MCNNKRGSKKLMDIKDLWTIITLNIAIKQKIYQLNKKNQDRKL